jgi:hypothetical protein
VEESSKQERAMHADTEKLAATSRHYAKLLQRARAESQRRRELARLLEHRRRRNAFEEALRAVVA